MSNATIQLTPPLRDYLLSVGVDEPALLKQLRDETAQLAEARMQICPEQGAFMQTLVHATGARRALEVGVFTGYSGMAVALAMQAIHGEDCRLVACDISETYVAKARGHWREAGVDQLIETRIGPAADSLRTLLAEGHGDSFDLMFIDADKSSYDIYYEHSLALLRPGGLIAVDNTLWGGAVADPEAKDPDTDALKALNLKMRDDPRIDFVLLPIADGMNLARKR